MTNKLGTITAVLKENKFNDPAEPARLLKLREDLLWAFSELVNTEKLTPVQLDKVVGLFSHHALIALPWKTTSLCFDDLVTDTHYGIMTIELRFKIKNFNNRVAVRVNLPNTNTPTLTYLVQMGVGYEWVDVSVLPLPQLCTVLVDTLTVPRKRNLNR